MEGRFSLIKNEEANREKRLLPRFPFTYLTFKAENGSKVFEVKDISYLGMQLSLRDGGHGHREEDEIKGTLYWRGNSLNLTCHVKWINSQGLGVSFKTSESFEKDIKEFLCLDNIVKGLRPLHAKDLELELPNGLKYWLRADGPVEIFVWQHSDGELARFQVILMDNFIEWEDGKGVKTGKVLQVHDKETALNTVDELILELDSGADAEKVRFARSVICQVPQNILPQEDNAFLTMKLSG